MFAQQLKGHLDLLLLSVLREGPAHGYALIASLHERSGGAFESELMLFSGKTIDIPSIFISGSSDWGVYQRPGAVKRMNGTACTAMTGVRLLDGAG